MLGTYISLTSSFFAGATAFIIADVALAVYFDSKALARKRLESDFEQQAVERMRASSAVFRNAEPLVRQLAKQYVPSAKLRDFTYCLELKEDSPPWTAPLFCATKLLEAILVGFGVALWFLLLIRSAIPAILLGFVFGAIVYYLTIKSYKKEANDLKRRIKLRLPFVVDLMSLTRGAGASFKESLEITVEENRDAPIGRVFKRVLEEFNLGKSEREVMDSLNERMQDWDFSELVFTLNRGAAFGVPIADALATLSNQMRLKRQQWIEQAAGKAQAQILFPGVIVMIACMIQILAPFVLMWFESAAS